jgi:hypothetical protein
VRAVGSLYPAPFAAWEIVYDFERLDRELMEIVDYHICPIALDQRSPVLEPCTHRRITKWVLRLVERSR